jgi:hypothetical protein
MTKQIPKKIWMLWLQGWDKAPEIVQKCRESWEKQNPGWEIIPLTEDSIKNHLEDSSYLENEKYTRQIKSNLTRLKLLKEHGGVWADATLFCMRPLDEWVHGATSKSGFFAFSKPGYDRMLSSWFIAAEKENYVTCGWLRSYGSFWSIGPMVSTSVGRFYYKIIHVLNTYLHLFFIVDKFFYINKRLFGLFPYFSFHYSFGREYRRNKKLREFWDKTEKISANEPHTISHYMKRLRKNKITDEEKEREEIMNFIKNNKEIPLYKLDWRFDIIEGNIIDWLIKNY